MDITEAREIAAQCWCTEKTERTEMDVDLAEAFAQKLVELIPDAGHPLPFQQELTALINKHSRENHSDTPDFILAEYMNSCLHTFTDAVNSREEWYGRKTRPGDRLAEAVKTARGEDEPPAGPVEFA